METGITFTFAAIFLGAAVLSSVALYARQPIIIAYIALGVALGPFGLKVVSDTELVSDAGHVGIIFLLFLLGLDMKPSALWNSLRQSTVVALASAVAFATVGYGLRAYLDSRASMPRLSAPRSYFHRLSSASNCSPPRCYTTGTWANS